ncbi:formate dehydrogenase subunit alpha [Parasporobacterium paucivorans]|uniref:NAD-dependent formate dehydrogenase catalytic subunit n=1 Tax=Parasporobacterium paucivorans DSM 15970 TaxID=1122934 RepID=A0A1M6A0U7_9FIRM|nr:formate dehydrogenase subunit alpha [Parasporobacterium paucivorans]SHI30100.1 NAD-dependent formate dehydrogenase catalytic subunit [Parasporobacterium paucivorans DSM 15970]
MPKLTIDNIQIEVPEGTTILEASTQLGIDIPTLCHMKELSPEGSCRMCLVEVENARGLQTSCNTICSEGMVVRTDTEKVIDSHRFVLDMLLSNHNLDCFNCAANGQCKLQDYCVQYGVERTSFKGLKCTEPVDTSSPFFDFDHTKCILCRKCVRTCEHIQCDSVLSAADRGFGTSISTFMGVPYLESGCVSCGNCVQACPVGALTLKDSKKYRVWETKKVTTTCPHCATGCQMNLIVKKGKIVAVEGAPGPANEGQLCVKGRFGSHDFVHSPDRLKHPLIKKNGKFEQATWDEALDLIASKMTELKKKYGPNSLAGFSCSRAPNEDNYVMQKMVRTVFETNNVDNCARVCHSATVAGLAITLGSGAMTNTIKDITEEPEVMLIVGSNTTEAHPVIGSRIRRAKQNGCKLIVVDPRETTLAEEADIHLKIRPGTNVAFANGIMNIIISEGLEDKEYIAARTEGYDEIKKIVAEYTPEKVAAICRIDADALREAAIMYAKAEKAPIIYCLGVTEHSTGTEGVMSMSNIAMLVGKIGKAGCGVNPLRGQNNVQGACDMGCLPTDFPGYQKANKPEVISKFEKAWGVSLSSSKGLTSTEVFVAANEGKIKGLYIFGEDPIVTDPDTGHVNNALNNIEFLVVQELFMTETAAYADVILPGASYAQKEGTFSNTERRVQRVRKAVELEGEQRLDTDIFCDLMTRMGYPAHYDSASDIMDEVARLTPSFGGISFERLDRGESLQWPCTYSDHPGTPIMHCEVFSRGLGYFYPAVYKPAAELPDEEYPILLNTGRMLYHYNTRAMTGRSPGINIISNSSYIEINYKDAQKLGIGNHDRVKVYSRRGELETEALVGRKVNEGESFMTFHFPDGNANKLTNAALDEFARIPEYKVCAIKIEKA